MKKFLHMAGVAVAGFALGCMAMHMRHLEAENEMLTDMLDDGAWPCDCMDPCATCEGCDGCVGDGGDADDAAAEADAGTCTSEEKDACAAGDAE